MQQYSKYKREKSVVCVIEHSAKDLISELVVACFLGLKYTFFIYTFLLKLNKFHKKPEKLRLRYLHLE